jgi:drug/metabolite transporter (DMT)-like permease
MAERENMSQGEHDTSKRLTGSQLIGRVVCFIGAILFLGNVTGGFPSIPYAGTILMPIGAVLWSAPSQRYVRIPASNEDESSEVSES